MLVSARRWARPARSRGLLTQTFEDYVVPSYGRYTDIELDRGDGNRVWDTQGKQYLDMGGGIAVNALGAFPILSIVHRLPNGVWSASFSSSNAVPLPLSLSLVKCVYLSALPFGSLLAVTSVSAFLWLLFLHLRDAPSTLDTHCRHQL